MLCSLVFQPVITVIQVVIAVIENVLVLVCTLIQEIVGVLENVLQYVCNNVVKTVCGAVCGVVCGICDFFCGFFGCSCGCENICNNVCNTVTQVVCGWTYVLEIVLEAITQLVCNYILQAIIVLLNTFEAIVTMILTWVCSIIDIIIRWFLCWTYIAEGIDFITGSNHPRSFRVSPKIVRNAAGYSDWFVYVNNADDAGDVDQTQMYVLSDQGRPLLPVLDRATGDVVYYEVAVHRGIITGGLRKHGRDGGYITGNPFLYYPYKVMEIASHLFGDAFGSDPADDGTGTDFTKNLFTYLPNVQAWLNGDSKLASNNYNSWTGKYTDPTSQDYFGDDSIPDMGMRVDTDGTCSEGTYLFLNLANGGIQFTPPNTEVAENMTCGSGESLTFDDTNFLMLNKADSTSVTTYFVSRYNSTDTSQGCNDLLGYTIVTFQGAGGPLFTAKVVLPFEEDTNTMMSRIVENVSGTAAKMVRVAETYLHESSHQCGLLHDTDRPNCENDTTLHIAKLMFPSASVRRVYTRIQWCMVRGAVYATTDSLPPFTQAPELPDSGSVPGTP